MTIEHLTQLLDTLDYDVIPLSDSWLRITDAVTPPTPFTDTQTALPKCS